MPDEIDLGDGHRAEFCDGEFVITDELPGIFVQFGIDAARKFCRFVEEKAGKE